MSAGSPAAVRRCLLALSRRISDLGFTSCDFSLLSDGLISRSLDAFCWCVLGFSAGCMAGIALRLVRVPGHIFVRWRGAHRVQVNWEPVGRPYFRTDAWYRSVYSITPARRRSSYLEEMDDRGFAALTHLRLAEYWRMRGDPDRRQKLVEEAARLAPGYPECWRSLGQVESARGRIQEALRCMEKAVERDPHDAALWHELGVLFGKAQRHAHALECFERALRCDPARRDSMVYRDATRRLLTPGNGRRFPGAGRNGFRVH
jgi:tetratricopeptide (TPR) repeat protein